MSDQDTTMWKSSFWILMLVLIFVYALYNHYAETLKEQIKHDPAGTTKDIEKARQHGYRACGYDQTSANRRD